MSKQLYIGEIAELFGISTKTLRHYEKLGLLQPRRAENDYRIFPNFLFRLAGMAGQNLLHPPAQA